MRLGFLPKLTIVLLMASPFAYAEFECLPLAGTTQFMSMSGGSGCPQRSFKVVGSSQCEVVLHEPQCTGVEGEWFGTYRYTGSVFDAQPDPDDPDEPHNNSVNVAVFYEAVAPALTEDPYPVIATNNVGKSLVDFSQKMTAALTTTNLNIGIVNTEIDRAQSMIAGNLSEIRNVRTEVQQVSGSLTNLASISSERQILNLEEHKKTQDLVTEVKEVTEQSAFVLNELSSQTQNSLSTIQFTGEYNKAMIDNLWNYEGEQASLEATRFDELTYQMQNLTDQVIDMEGSGGFSDDDRDNLIDTNVAAWNTYDRLAGTNNQLSDLSNQTSSNFGQIMTGVYTTHGEQMQALAGIQSALDNGTGGGSGDDDTETNQKLDGLGEKLDGIKGALDGFSDTTGMASQLNDSVTNSNAELSTEMDTMFESFGTEEKISQLEITVSGMVNDSGLSDYDTVDKVRNSLSSATTISQVFDVSRASCSPYSFWTKEINFCPAAEKSSMVLEYFIWAITAIFAFLHITAFLSKLRTE